METCYHCGDVCNTKISFEEKSFCCSGCKTVYQILSENGLSNYYHVEQNPGVKPEKESKFHFLENQEISESLLDFNSDSMAKVTLFLPQIHCSSCIWLLENLTKLHEGILQSEVNFTQKKAYISFNPNLISLKNLSEILEKIGYSPVFEKKKESRKRNSNSLLIKIGLTGFCFGNIMLLSFPEYLGLELDDSKSISFFFQLLIFILSVPVILFSASDYLISAYKTIRSKNINIDVPISIGIIALYLKSTYDILILHNASYMDSFVGFIFFLLIGKWFQSKTYSSLSFEREYESYFPMGVTKIHNEQQEIIPLNKIEIDDVILIRNEEIIPSDAILLNEKTNLDYSFVTGESNLIPIKKGEKIFAGGKNIGSNIQIKINQKVKQSYLTHLWNQDAFQKEESPYSEIHSRLSKNFTFAILTIAFISGIVWYFIDYNQIVNIITSILIVACPCALALSVPFTFGTSMRIWGRRFFYLKNSFVVEKLASITDLVFDKTGTITHSNTSSIDYIGETLNHEELEFVNSLVGNSSHTLSKLLHQHLMDYKMKEMTHFEEKIGKGLSGIFNETIPVKIGSSEYLNRELSENETCVHVSINNIYKGKFTFKNEYRKDFKSMIPDLKNNYKIHILSGDNSQEKENLNALLNQTENILFNQKPIDKLNYIKKLQEKGKVMMIGDGLNDAGALKQSDIGVVISENSYNFTPSSDAILEASSFGMLPSFLYQSKKSITVLKVCFFFSILYNLIGLGFAISGSLTPLIAAILMPLSSIFVVVISTSLVHYYFRKS